VLRERPAHLVQVAGDDGVQARPGAAPVPPGHDGDAAARPLGGELVAGELGSQPAQLRRRARHAGHEVPAGIMMCRVPAGSVVAVTASRSLSKVR
jgi:hypothetical protein